MLCQTATLGTVCAAVIAMPALLGTVNHWWYIYLIEMLTFIPVLGLLLFLPESPGYGL